MLQRLADTHIHIWNFKKAEYEWLKNETPLLNRNYEIGELNEERIQVGITDGVLVQAANNADDTNWMLAVAERTDWIKGVVGWLPLMDPDATAKALGNRYASDKYLKGVRHLIHDEPDPKWLLQTEVIESLRILSANGLSYDIVGINGTHIETALAVADLIPDLKMIFDHLNQPPISTKEKFGAWGQLMAEAAKHENFCIKISGLGTASKNFKNWQAEDIKPYVGFALEHFGTDRCLLGGDWPVCLLAQTYGKTWQAYKDVLNDMLNEEEMEKVFYNNAQGFYRI